MARVLILFLFLFSVNFYSEELSIEELDPNMALKKADEKGMVWFSPSEKPFRLVGFKWIDKDKVFRRLPVKPDWPIRKAVDNLANSTAGGQLSFQTDSPKVTVRVKLSRQSGMYHMPATGQSGFDIYIGKPGQQKYFRTAKFGAKVTDYVFELFSGPKGNRHFTINFPLYNGVKSLALGVKAGSIIKAPLPFVDEESIVVYGTSITQGGCAARPGMAYSNILSRRLNSEFVNLGFSGNGKGEPALAHLINQIEKKKMVVLDYEANVGEGIKKTLEPFIDLIRSKNPLIPILVISKITYAAELAFPSQMKTLKDRAAFQKNLVEKKKAAGDQNIYFLDGGTLLGEYADECTVDGVHPTTLGFMKMANGIEPVIRRILNLSKN
jgi:hypothetical protein